MNKDCIAYEVRISQILGEAIEALAENLDEMTDVLREAVHDEALEDASEAVELMSSTISTFSIVKRRADKYVKEGGAK